MSSTDDLSKRRTPAETVSVPELSSDEELMSEDEVPAKELRAEKRPATEDQLLTQHWKRTKTKGKGTDLVQKYAYLFEGVEDDFERTGFIQVRLTGPKEKRILARKPRAKDGDKNLRYSNCSPEIQRGLDQTRAAEWRKWLTFPASTTNRKRVLNV